MVANGPRGKIYNGPISRFVYNAFFNTYTKFRAFITKCTIVTNFLLCRLTITTAPLYSLILTTREFNHVR